MFIIRSLVVTLTAILLATGCGSKPDSNSHTHDPRHLAVDILAVQSEPVPIIKQIAGQEGELRFHDHKRNSHFDLSKPTPQPNTFGHDVMISG